MCKSCADFPRKVKITTQEVYKDLLSRACEKAASGEFRIFMGECGQDAVMKEGVWVDDILVHRFRCNGCGRFFDLSVDTYHGFGSWQKKNILDVIFSLLKAKLMERKAIKRGAGRFR